jgi:hypothetical protein
MKKEMDTDMDEPNDIWWLRYPILVKLMYHLSGVLLWLMETEMEIRHIIKYHKRSERIPEEEARRVVQELFAESKAKGEL